MIKIFESIGNCMQAATKIFGQFAILIDSMVHLMSAITIEVYNKGSKVHKFYDKTSIQKLFEKSAILLDFGFVLIFLLFL